MAINPALLIAAPMLQDLLIDKTSGLPLTGGIVKFYQDTSRSTFKNIYYQTGSPGSYTYIATNNPMTLTGVGTFADPSGNDIIPFFYPYSETDSSVAQPYYIEVYNSLNQLQFTRSNFPFLAGNGTTSETILNQRNYIVNNVLFHNIGTTTVSGSTAITIAPGAHEGFSMPDVQFIKSNTTATDVISFPAVSGIGVPFQGDVTPEVCLNFECSAAGSGESLKVIQWPVNLHIQSLTGQQGILTYWAMSSDGAAIQPYIYGFAGTGAPSQPAPQPIGSTITLGTTWTQYKAHVTFPSTTGMTLPSATGDDAIYLQFGLPLNSTCNISIIKPTLSLGTELPATNLLEFDTYDEIDAITNSPRTGDIKTTLQSSAVPGWLMMNDQTIGNPSSGATNTGVYLYSLYALIWTNFSATTYTPIYTSAGVLSTFGASPQADWNANKRLSLTKMLGRVLSGANPTPTPIVSKVFTASSSGGLLITVNDGTSFYRGTTVQVSNTGGALPTGLSAATNYYVAPVPNTAESASTFLLCLTLADAINYTNGIAFTDAGSGTNTIFTINEAHPFGSYVGEDTHALFEAQTPAHTHALTGSVTASTPNPYFYGGSGGTPLASSGVANEYKEQTTVTVNNTLAVAASTPNDNAHNNIQPTVYVNVMIKT